MEGAGKQVRIIRHRDALAHELQTCRARAFLLRSTLRLGPMQAAALHRYLVIRAAQGRIVFADVDGNASRLRTTCLLLATSRLPPNTLPLTARLLLTASHGIQVKLFGLPRFSIFWKSAGVSRGLEGFLSDDPRDLMVAVPIRRCTRETRNDDLGSELPDHAHKVAENAFASPFLECFIRAFGKSELVIRRKELLCPIEAARGQQFLGSNDAERFK